MPTFLCHKRESEVPRVSFSPIKKAGGASGAFVGPEGLGADSLKKHKVLGNQG